MLSEYYKFQNVDTLLLIADDLIKTAEKIKSNRFLESGYSIKSLGLKFKGDFGMATGFAQKALEINTRSENKINIAKILLNYAHLLRQQKQYDVCEKYHREGIGIAKIEKDSALLARYYINTGLMFADMNKLDSAFHFYNQGISITDKFKDLRKIGITARLNLSALASKQKNYKEMIRLAHEVYKYGVQENDADHISLGAISADCAASGNPFADWVTAEVPRDLACWFQSEGQGYRTIVVDCLTLWLSNVCGRRIVGADMSARVDEVLQAIRRTPARVVLVSNELGFGLVPTSRSACAFRDAAGRVNQQIAAAADEVYFVISGQPLRLK